MAKMNIEIPHFEKPHEMDKWIRDNFGDPLADNILAFIMEAYQAGIDDKSLDLLS